MEKTRPTFITVVSWVLIVIGASGVFSLLMMFMSNAARAVVAQQAAATGMPVWISVAMSCIGIAVALTAGIGMLQRHGWVRFVYVGWHAVTMSVSFTLFASKMPGNIGLMIPGLMIFIAISILMFLPAANRYFSSQAVADNEPQTP
ncbi:MAG: hypothetical protein LBE22_10925 [Azoarcus sp.]|jgi:hypothetical protein|nr:hypothetical protein [Azoarcus sp.]